MIELAETNADRFRPESERLRSADAGARRLLDHAEADDHTPTTAKPTTTAKPKPTTTATTLPTTTVLDTAPPASAPPSTLLADPGVTTIPERMQEGRGTFHRYDNTDPQWGDHPCAHRTLPKGTVVTVVNIRTGASTWCIMKDRGPYGNAIIDLDEEQFVEIAPVAAGVINVRITW